MEKQLTGYPSVDKPWLKYCSSEMIASKLPEETLYDHIRRRNKDNLDHIALNYYGTKITYEQLIHTIDQIASALNNLGVESGDIVTIIMINSPITVALMLALNKLGAIANMVYGADTSIEICRHINEAQSSFVFIVDIFQDKVLEIIDQTNVKNVVVSSMIEGMSFVNRLGARLVKKIKHISLPKDQRFINWKTFVQEANDDSPTMHDPSATAFITYTGGTTGGSKGVMLSNKAVLAVAYQYIIAEKELSRSGKWMQVLPLFIAYGVTCSLMIPLSVGMEMIIRIPMADSIFYLCKKFRPNHIIYGPAFWEAFADNNRDLDLSYLIAPISGGDTLSPKVEQKIDDYLTRNGSPYLLMNGYGMTEVGAAVSVNFKHAYEFGSVGTPFVKNIVSAFDVETGKELIYGQEGEICIHTPSMMTGYLNNEEETSNIIRKHEDGLLWIHSGDLGWISEDGFIHISGRLKRYMLTIANGIQKKVFSLDIEKKLIQHPLVEKCAVVPVDDEVMNQVPVAFIVLSDNKQNQLKMEHELAKYAESKLDPMYRPIRYCFVDQFPLTKIGKVDYHALEKVAEGK